MAKRLKVVVMTCSYRISHISHDIHVSVEFLMAIRILQFDYDYADMTRQLDASSFFLLLGQKKTMV